MPALTSCPKCSGRVGVPPGAAENQWVRCPVCGAEYRLTHVLEYQPPELELIDEPAAPAEGRIPAWAAVAAAAADAASALGVSEVAAPLGDLPEVEVLVPPPIGAAQPVVSAEIDDESDVITFDDSLLLDEPTDVLPAQGPPALPASIAPAGAVAMSDADFFQAMSRDSAVDDRDESASEIDWPDDDTLEPYEISDNVGEHAPSSEIGLAQDQEEATVFEPASQFGLPPRRKSRRGNPLAMIAGVVGGGVLGLAIGYAILMWGFAKDPFALGPKLPDFLVPAALRPINNPRVVQAVPAGEDHEGSDVPNSGDIATSDQPDTTADDRQDDPSTLPVVPSEPTKSDADASTAGARAAPADDPLADPFGESAATQRAAQRPAVEEDPTPDQADAIGPTGERVFSPEELMAAVNAAQATTEAAVTLPADADQAKKNEANFAYYANLSKVAEALTHLDRTTDEQAREKAIDAAIGSLLDAVPNAAQLAELGKLGGYWFGSPRGDGIVLAGMVKDSKPRGKLIESVVQTLGKPMRGDPPLIRVVSPSALTNGPRRPALIAGTIINDPTANLRGYEGSAERVVWAALALDPTPPRNE